MQAEKAAGTAREPDLQGCGAPPKQIRVWKGRDGLSLLWEDGASFDLSAYALRLNCQSAGEKKLRLIELDAPPGEDIAITAIQPLGSYAINIHFSDGHQRGIYPWSFLRQLAGDDVPANPQSEPGDRKAII